MNVALCLTLFKPDDEDLEYWRKISFELHKNGKELYILVDNPSLHLDNFSESTKIYQNKKNIGKFETIYYFLKKNYFKYSHIKIVDPDDRINLDEFMEFEVSHKGIIVMRNLRSDGTIIDHNTLGTSWTILPVDEIRNDEFYSKVEGSVKNWIEDQILGIICYLNGAKINRINSKWYIYNVQIGMTRKSITKEDAYEIISSLRIMSNLFLVTNKSPITYFPGTLWHLKKLINESEKISSEEKIFFCSELDKYKKDIVAF